MALGLRHQERTTVKATGTAVTVPNNDYAKLMYYLRSVNSCLPKFDLPTILTKYDQYRSLDDDDKKNIFKIAELLSPGLLLGKVFFPVPNGHSVLNGSSNEFYEISRALTLQALATDLEDAVFIQGRRVEITKIMFFKRSWMDSYYFSPIQNIRENESCAIL